MYAKRRRIYDLGNTRAVPIPNGCPIAEDSMGTVAMDRLLLVDTEGEYNPAELLGLLKKLERHIWSKPAKSRKAAP